MGTAEKSKRALLLQKGSNMNLDNYNLDGAQRLAAALLLDYFKNLKVKKYVLNVLNTSPDPV